MDNVVIVPMRSNSKGLKNKNIKDFSGLPLYFWTIKKLYYLLYTGKVTKIIVSSDSDWYLDRVKTSFSFMKEDKLILSKRPDELSTDVATTEDVCSHELQKHGINNGVLSIIEVTSPLVSVSALSLMFSAIDDTNDSAFLVYEDVGQFWKCNKKNDYKWEKLYTDRKMRQQETEALYREVGAWAIKVDKFKEYGNRIVDPCIPIVIEKELGLSINSFEEFTYGEFLMKEYAPSVFKDLGLYR